MKNPVTIATLRSWGERLPPRYRKPALIGAGSLLVLVIGVLVADSFSTPRHTPALAWPRTGDVVARGRVDVPTQIATVNASTSVATPVVAHIFVKEGDVVKAGQVIATLENHDLAKTALQEAEARLALSRIKLAAVNGPAREADIHAKEAAVQAATAKLHLSQSRAHRANLLRRRNVVSAATQEARDLETAQSQANLETERRQLVAMRDNLVNDRAVAAGNLTLAEAELDHARAELATTTIRAPFAGTVLKVSARDGEVVGPAGIARFADLSRLRVMADVPEIDAARLKLGDRAEITLRGRTHALSGRVIRIAHIVKRENRPDPEAAAPTDAHIVEVEILPDHIARFPPIIGYEATVRITP